MALNQIPKIVEGPTGVATLTVEKGLPHRVAEDVKSADALPLLAFALRELFERYGRERRLTIADYRSSAMLPLASIRWRMPYDGGLTTF